MTSPNKVYIGVAKHVMKYLKSTLDFNIWFEKTKEINLYCFCDSDWVGHVDDSKSTSRNVFSLDSRAIAWNSKKQESTAQFIMEAKYILVASATNQAIWLCKLPRDLGLSKIVLRSYFATTSQLSLSLQILCNIDELNTSMSNSMF